MFFPTVFSQLECHEEHHFLSHFLIALTCKKPGLDIHHDQVFPKHQCSDFYGTHGGHFWLSDIQEILNKPN